MPSTCSKGQFIVPRVPKRLFCAAKNCATHTTRRDDIGMLPADARMSLHHVI
jgi:hypothetical protein